LLIPVIGNSCADVTTALSSLTIRQDDLGRMGQITRDPISAALYFVPAISRLHENRSHAGIPPTRDVARLVADNVGSRQVEAMIALGFEDHPGRWLTPR
jgi:hypothetical protein